MDRSRYVRDEFAALEQLVEATYPPKEVGLTLVVTINLRGINLQVTYAPHGRQGLATYDNFLMSWIKARSLQSPKLLRDKLFDKYLAMSKEITRQYRQLERGS